MEWRYRLDPLSMVEGWTDEARARAWARSATGHYRDARASSSLDDYLRHWRAARDALNNAVRALNLHESSGAGPIDENPATGLPRIAIGAGSAQSDARRRAYAAHGGAEGFLAWARGLEAGRDYYFAAPDGREWGVRLVPDADGAGLVPMILADRAEVLAQRAALPLLQPEQRAAAIVADPWRYYVEARQQIDRDNEARAARWGITDPEGVASFKLAGDVLADTLQREWIAADRERTNREFARMMDRASEFGALVPVAGWAVAGLAQALKLLGPVLPWVTVEPPAGPRARALTGGTVETARPTHTVPDPPGAKGGLMIGAGARDRLLGGTGETGGTGGQPAGTLGASRQLLRLPSPTPEILLAAQGGVIERQSVGLQAAGGSSSGGSGLSTTQMVIGLAVVAGLAYALSRR